MFRYGAPQVNVRGVDWASLLEELDWWKRVQLADRTILLRNAGRRFFGGSTAQPRDTHETFLQVLLSIETHGLNGQDPDQTTRLCEYLSDTMSYEEKMRFFKGAKPSSWRKELLPRHFSSKVWHDAFFAIEDLAAWEAGVSGPPGDRSVPHKAVTKTARSLLLFLRESGQPVPLTDAFAAMDGSALPVTALAASVLVRHFWCFLSLRAPDIEPCVGLWQPFVERLRRAAPSKPRALEPEGRYRQAFLIDDMTAIVGAALTEPLRMKSDGHSLYSAPTKEVECRMKPHPAWTNEILSSGDDRLYRALSVARKNGLVEEVKSNKGCSALGLTPRGREWIARPLSHRLRDVVDSFRQLWSTGMPGDGSSVDCCIGVRRDADLAALLMPEDYFSWLGGIYGSQDAAEFVHLNEFLDYYSRTNNLLMDRCAARAAKLPPDQALYEEEVERESRDLLRGFLVNRLLALDGAVLGLTRDGALCFCVTDVGRYLLGVAASLSESSPDARGIIVNPDFEIVFPAPNPVAEAEISRLADRVAGGRDVGSLFRITRTSVMKFASAGGTAEAALASLSRCAEQRIPANVEHEIRGWIAQCRHVGFRTASLVECPDAETAMRVRAIDPANIRPLTDTVLELPGLRYRADLVGKLRKVGIFEKPQNPQPAGLRRQS
jgi:hypothetical protein